MIGYLVAILLLAGAQAAPAETTQEPIEPVARPGLSWERQLSMHLARYQIYPPAALREEMQGTAYVQFRMNRAGKVLSLKLHRSSGSALLDEEALNALIRAEPLPAIPADRPDEIDLMMPVSFRIAD